MSGKGRFDPLTRGHPNGQTWQHPGHSRSRNERATLSLRLQSPHGTLQPAVSLHRLGTGQPPYGKLDGGDGYESGQGLGEVFEVLGQATISAEP